MEDLHGDLPLSNPLPFRYLTEETDDVERKRLIGFMRCYDCQGNVPLDQADSFMCRKVHQTITKLSSRGWKEPEILAECKRIYGNDILMRHFEPPPPTISYKFVMIAWAAYMLRLKFFRVRWEKNVKYKRDRYF
mmetsp:Transcript_18338/g.32955  ORF Transcript_18338/g.32955 Transcript_18338/m.32955 type:complete len:134 (+) Transcript_18338:4888-5289(+)